LKNLKEIQNVEIVHQSYHKRLEFIQKTAAQLIKDFQLHGLEITFSGNAETAYTELSEQVKPIIDDLIMHDSQRFMNLLYSIDLNEKKVINEALHAFDLDILTDQILKRELQKVVTREYFKEKLKK
jgi:hypothetical protein